MCVVWAAALIGCLWFDDGVLYGVTFVVGVGGVRRRTGATTLTDLGVAGGAPALSKEKKKERGQVPHRSGDTARATPLGRHRSGDTARATRVR